MRLVVKEVNTGYWDPFGEEKPKPKPDNCVICGLELEDGRTYSCPHCGAVGHSACWDDWLLIRKTCPLCRRVIAEV